MGEICPFRKNFAAQQQLSRRQVNLEGAGTHNRLATYPMTKSLHPAVLSGIALLSFFLPLLAADSFNERERGYVKEMPHAIQKDLDTNYFDPTFHGVDMKSRYQEAETRIQNSKSFREAMESLEWVLDGLNDSHTYLIPPHQPFQIEYGFAFQFYGSNC